MLPCQLWGMWQRRQQECVQGSHPACSTIAGPHFSQAVRHKSCLCQPAYGLRPKGSFLHSCCIPLGTGIIYNGKIIPTNGEKQARQAWSKAQKPSVVL